MEELVFRGAMWNACRELGLGVFKTCLFTALAFMVLHIPGWIMISGIHAGLLTQGLLIIVAGIFFGISRWITGSIFPAAGLHILNNANSSGAFLYAFQLLGD